jgi:hypothetical protein
LLLAMVADEVVVAGSAVTGPGTGGVVAAVASLVAVASVVVTVVASLVVVASPVVVAVAVPALVVVVAVAVPALVVASAVADVSAAAAPAAVVAHPSASAHSVPTSTHRRVCRTSRTSAGPCTGKKATLVNSRAQTTMPEPSRGTCPSATVRLDTNTPLDGASVPLVCR